MVLPITDPYVLHHGALGSFAWVYLPRADRERARAAFAALDGVEEVYTREEAAVIYRAPRRPHRRSLGRVGRPDRAREGAGQARPDGRRERAAVARRAPRADRPDRGEPPLSPRYAAWHAAGAQSRDLFDFVLNGVMGDR